MVRSVRPPLLVIVTTFALSAALAAAERDASLAHAARTGDAATVEALLREGAGVDTPDPHGTTALHWATYRDDAEMATRLIAAGADVNRSNRYGATPLSLACVSGNPALIGPLLEVGAFPNLRAAGEPPLLTCARSGQVEAVELLLAHGANPNITDGWKGQTAVMWAAEEDHAAVVETLVAHGADIDTKATPGETALLYMAVQLGHEATVRSLLAAGADATVTDPSGASLLHAAASADHHRLGLLLLDRGIDPNISNASGQTALHAVVEARRLKHQSRRTTPGPDSFAFMERLIAAGAEIDATMSGPPAQNALDQADDGSSDGDEEGDPEEEGGQETESLDTERAVETTEVDAPVEQAEHIEGETEDAGSLDDDDEGADERKAEPDFGFAAIDNGVDLIDATPFLLAARAADLDAMRLLLDHGADPLATTKGGNTALLLAAGLVFAEGGFGQGDGPPKADVLEAVRLLLELGCDINAANASGQTALHGAVYREATETIRYLVAQGARTDAEDASGRTPLQLAEEGFNQAGSRIRRYASAELLREIEERLSARAGR